MRFRMSPLTEGKRWSLSYYSNATKRWHMSVFRPVDKTDIMVCMNWLMNNRSREYL